MKQLVERLGGGAQILRGLLGLAFPYLLAILPTDKRVTWPLIIVGILSYIAARWLVLFEPKTLLDMGPLARGHWGEAIFVSLALVIALVILHEAGFGIGIGASIIVVIVYLIAHIMLLPVLVMYRIAKVEPEAERPNLRRFIRGASFVAGEAVAVMTIGLALHYHESARSGPDWGLWDITPIMPLVWLIVGYTPIIWLEMAATKQRTTRQAEVHGAIEASLLQAGAIVVSALTGRAPWI